MALILRICKRSTKTLTCQRSRQVRLLSNDVVTQFQNLLGESNVSIAETTRQHHGQDESPFPGAMPDVVVSPKNTEQVSSVAKICYERKLPMIPYGTGTGLEGGVCAVKGGVCLDLSQMEESIDVNMSDLDATVTASITRIALNNYLHDTGLWFPIDPGADASLCGMVATSASGTTAVRYGTMRENVINLEVVLADGSILHTAGKGLHPRKTAAGYNLTNLFVGSEGTLGIITKATLRLYSIPEKMSATCSFPSTEDAINSVEQILLYNVPIVRIEFLDESAVDACNKYSHLDHPVQPMIFLEFYGSKAEIESQVDIVEEVISSQNGTELKWAKTTEEHSKLWKARHNALYAAKALRPGSKAKITDVAVPISKLAEILTKTKEEIKKEDLLCCIVGHVGDGNFHCLVMHDPSNQQELEKIEAFSSKLAIFAQDLGGTCTGEHGIGLGKMKLLEREVGNTGMSVMKSIKKALDPHNLLNPGHTVEIKLSEIVLSQS
ncbi:uncharacterized protein TRIADDRAFT_51388 [Trichoplax adhaerens]|uniref:Probable D-lactate dehydrogenase, mitochondrial n=1 Tax=Trichoplax adhaerens TaxID=10228 RepID=B3RIV9_TRIAD|nr:hypothetical protein TRIADDRAFT_51388 [Trichoplax adhaerens]EDV28457.1 hypothetical protein TRIADDRAFT_51388 [Trichoplax adhaerens]|eukprot:XP_002107659.1 hypothetical protein TRIADDRAFT_51388 [Trichoplax adhaerens]